MNTIVQNVIDVVKGRKAFPRIYGVERSGDGIAFIPPKPFTDLYEEREHRKKQLAAAFRLLARNGVEPGLNGHVTVRDPIDTDGLWINPIGVAFSQIKASDLVRVDGSGKAVEGDGPINVAGLPIHLTLQKAHTHVVGIIHAHSFHGQAWSTFGQPIEPLIDDFSLFHDDQFVFVPHAFPDETSEGRRTRFVNTFIDKNIVIWKNHGHWAVGRSVESAAWRFIAFELAAKFQLTVHSSGRPYSLARPADYTPEQRESLAALNFLPYWDHIIALEPDLQN